jgi:hypothetical protein
MCAWDSISNVLEQGEADNVGKHFDAEEQERVCVHKRERESERESEREERRRERERESERERERERARARRAGGNGEKTRQASPAHSLQEDTARLDTARLVSSARRP